MTDITFRVPDDLAHLLEQLVMHIPGAEIVQKDVNTPKVDERDKYFRQAILLLKQDRVIRRPRDYTWIMIALEQDIISDLEGFRSPQTFIDYLKQLGVGDVPCRTTLFNTYNNVMGQYPNWTFLDKPGPDEILRRNNVVVRFKSAYLRAKKRN